MSATMDAHRLRGSARHCRRGLWGMPLMLSVISICAQNQFGFKPFKKKGEGDARYPRTAAPGGERIVIGRL